MRSRKRARAQKRPVPRNPDFNAGLLPEPLLAFQGGHHHVDPKIGLGLYGPYSLVGQPRPALTSIIVGLVGPPAMVADTEQWLITCQGMIVNDGREPFLRPHFPGFHATSLFKCDLIGLPGANVGKSSISHKSPESKGLTAPKHYPYASGREAKRLHRAQCARSHIAKGFVFSDKIVSRR
jgi:hypothetical protein